METVEYKEGATTLEGLVARDTSITGMRPGVLVVHQWKGSGSYERRRAEMLAELGFIAFVVDIYGKGVRPDNPKEAAAEAGKYKGNRTMLRARILAGLETLKKQSGVDPKRIAAIGYCFGGTTVIELARAGANIAGVVSFHGGLDSPNPDDGKNIHCKVLVLHGADDPFVPAKDVNAFMQEMRDGKVDWQLVNYGGAVHSFTDRESDQMNMKGAAYNEKADKRSWAAMKDFFAEIFR